MRLPRKTVGLLLAAGMTVGMTAAAAPAHAADYLVFATTTANQPPGGLCLEADRGPTFAYQVASQPCDSANQAQQWVEIPQGGGVDKFENRAIGWCLYTDTVFDGSIIALWDCNANISNTRWVWTHNNIWGISQLQSRISGTSGHCLDVPGRQTLAGLRLQLYGCNGTSA
jgi:hypothetical protein